MPKYAELVYNGFWFSPERLALQALVDETQKFCSGTVRVKLYKGNTIVVGRKSPYSLYDSKVSSFEDDGGAYDQKDAAGFIKLQALRLRTLTRARDL
jgi:argininosuccinate synthase